MIEPVYSLTSGDMELLSERAGALSASARDGALSPNDLEAMVRLLEVQATEFDSVRDLPWFKQAWSMVSGERGRLVDQSVANLGKVQLGVLRVVGDLLGDVSSLNRDLVSVLRLVERVEVDGLELRRVILAFNQRHRVDYRHLRADLALTKGGVRAGLGATGLALLVGAAFVSVPVLRDHWAVGATLFVGAAVFLFWIAVVRLRDQGGRPGSSRWGAGPTAPTSIPVNTAAFLGVSDGEGYHGGHSGPGPLSGVALEEARSEARERIRAVGPEWAAAIAEFVAAKMVYPVNERWSDYIDAKPENPREVVALWDVSELVEEINTGSSELHDFVRANFVSWDGGAGPSGRAIRRFEDVWSRTFSDDAGWEAACNQVYQAGQRLQSAQGAVAWDLARGGGIALAGAALLGPIGWVGAAAASLALGHSEDRERSEALEEWTDALLSLMEATNAWEHQARTHIREHLEWVVEESLRDVENWTDPEQMDAVANTMESQLEDE